MASNTISTVRSVSVHEPPDTARALVEQAIANRKGTIIEGDAELSAKFGSQAMLRLIGGWLISTKSFPVRAHVDFEPIDGGTRLEIRVADAMGVGAKSGMRGKYERAVAELADHLAAVGH